MRSYGGVDRETYEHYQNEYGGTPHFDRNGQYTGFTMSPEELASGGYNNSGPDDPFGDGRVRPWDSVFDAQTIR